MKTTKSIWIMLTCVLWLAGASYGRQAGTPWDPNPGRKSPSSPALAYVVLPQQSLEETVKELQPANKIKDLISGDTIGCRVFVQHEKDVSTNQAEVHDGTDDVFIVMEGTATLTLGGTLDSPKQIQPGEWRGSSIAGGKEFKLNKGDVVIVPRGTPHVRTTAGQEVTLMIVKSTSPQARR